MAALILLTAVALAGCGGASKEDKAKDQVCSARDDIAKQVDTLKGMTVSTATTDQIKKSLGAIRSDLSDITDAQGDLNEDRQAQVKSANEAFASEVKTVLGEVGRSRSLASAKQQLTSALQRLATTYQATLSKVDCGGS